MPKKAQSVSHERIKQKGSVRIILKLSEDRDQGKTLNKNILL